jgi:DNA-binding transcriptional MerR regulator
MAELELLQPSDVARALEVSPSTLRRWSAEFAPFLSDSAGRPSPSPQGEPVHRRYTAADVAVLAEVRDLLRQGQTYQQITAQFASRKDGEEGGERETGLSGKTQSVVPLQQPTRVVTPAFAIITDALQSVMDGQQSVLSSQQANRDLLGVVIQDNFNLKEENTRLRDRMLHLERELSEIRRRGDETRREVLERLHTLEEAQNGAAEKPRRGCLAKFLGIR